MHGKEPAPVTTDSKFAGGQFSPLHILNGAVPTCSLLLEDGCEHLQKDRGYAHPPISAHFFMYQIHRQYIFYLGNVKAYFKKNKECKHIQQHYKTDKIPHSAVFYICISCQQWCGAQVEYDKRQRQGDHESLTIQLENNSLTKKIKNNEIFRRDCRDSSAGKGVVAKPDTLTVIPGESHGRRRVMTRHHTPIQHKINTGNLKKKIL